MGITGLIPFLEKSSRQVNVSQYSGCTVALDAYCWLHKGTFSCADKLARGDKTDAYVHYCMKYVNMLLSHNIKPILVFDGRHLPAKADTEKKRRKNRELNKRRAAELLRQDKPNEARTFLQRCVDVTHTMALELMRECRRRNVDCITAPYEADAQLAYLNMHDFAHIVITEDSDLLLFGCSKVMFKLDLNGNGLLVEQERLHLAMGLSKGCFTLDKFRHMCILSGCDYLSSLPNIGLAKALRFVKSTVDPDIHRALSRLGSHLKMNIVVPLEYRDKFLEAEAMFRHQPVFDPLSRRLVPLTPLPAGAPPHPLLSRETLTPDQQLQLALGNLDPFTLQTVDTWDPDTAPKSGGGGSWNARLVAPHQSMWARDYKPRAVVMHQPDPCEVKRSSTNGRVVERKVDIPHPSAKRPLPSTEEEINAMRLQFGTSPHPSKKPCYDDEHILELLDKADHTPPKSEVVSPEPLESPKKSHLNPFTKKTPQSENKFSGLSKLAQFRRTSVGEIKVQSRYFGSQSSIKPSPKPENSRSPNETLKDVSNIVEAKITVPDTPSNVKNLEKLSDSGINSFIHDLDQDTKDDKETVNLSNEKENNLESNKLKRENSFNWKPSLVDMFGFKSKSLSSSPAIRNRFITPTIDESKMKKESDDLENTPVNRQGNTTVKRNPFAKITKVEECSFSLGSQGSSRSKDSESDALTPELVNSEESFASSSSPSPCAAPKPQVKVGLSKKQSNGCQKSLLSMFAFKPKSKLQR